MVDPNEVEMSRVQVLVILGATGTGKSRLGIELGRRFSGEIISADSMQVYKGLDIITAKVTQEERKMVPHHMLDIADPGEWYRVVHFRDTVLPIIDDVMARKKLPIIVGGTNYYIESLLWKILISNPKEEDDKDEASDAKKSKLEIDRRIAQSNEELHKRLSEVDPEMANNLHPNNRRKIIRSLEIFEQHGVKHSELLKTQRAAGGSGLGGPLRYPDSIILWLRCDMNVLAERLDCRVNTMIETGLVQELLDFHRRYNEHQIKLNAEADYTIGILQSIGFKEFHSYLMLPEEERNTEKGKAALNKGIEDLRIATKRYAKHQEKWIMNRMIRRVDRQVPPIYTLDCTDVTEWDNRVLKPAEEIISAILRGEKPAQRPFNEAVENVKFTDSSNLGSHYCEICEKVLIGEYHWNAHIYGAKHKRVVQRKARLAKKQAAESLQQPNSDA